MMTLQSGWGMLRWVELCPSRFGNVWKDEAAPSSLYRLEGGDSAGQAG